MACHHDGVHAAPSTGSGQAAGFAPPNWLWLCPFRGRVCVPPGGSSLSRPAAGLCPEEVYPGKERRDDAPLGDDIASVRLCSY